MVKRVTSGSGGGAWRRCRSVGTGSAVIPSTATEAIVHARRSRGAAVETEVTEVADVALKSFHKSFHLQGIVFDF